MYSPPAFREERLDVLHALIETHPLGTLVTQGENGPAANLVPFSLDRSGERGVLRAHLAKANDQYAALNAGGPVLVIFQGPETYITPSWYPSKQEHGKVVPTWNYVMVQVTGRPVLIEDPAWLMTQINALTAAQEGKRPVPWAVGDAPDAFVAAQLKGIFGIEFAIETLEGKWKTSQNRPEGDRVGVEHGLTAEGATEMASLVGRR